MNKLDILEQKIKDRMQWYKAQEDYDPRYPNTYRDSYDQLDEVLGMIEEIRKDDK